MTQKSIKLHPKNVPIYFNACCSDVDGGGGVRSVSFNLTPFK